ncbi:MAG: hypothetical protein CMJ18_03520 [Phycisphaeraceae bacterium]|nr:hypothetical protein [Phycisphaeraceae bacterium]
MGASAEHAARLQRLFDEASELWSQYDERGPGRMDKVCFERVDSAAAAVRKSDEAWPDDVAEAGSKLCDLSEQCVCRPQGLCFVTGEAGLIPRRDQHEAFEAALKVIDSHLQRAGTDG